MNLLDIPSPEPIGQLIRGARKLNDAQIEKVIAYQRSSGLRFGEAAVALRLVERNDVLEALSVQFQYVPAVAPGQRSSELVAAVDPFGEQAEAFRDLRSRLLLERWNEAPRCALAVMSPDMGDGKSYLAANLAVTFSQLRERTLLIDADLRTPRQHRLFGVETKGPGLSGALAGFAGTSELVHEVPGLPNLYLAPAGAVPPNPVELLQRPGFGALMHKLLQQFDHVLVDTPAAIRGADSRVIAARCGATLFVARTGRSRMAALEGLLSAVSRGPARVAGVVMNEH